MYNLFAHFGRGWVGNVVSQAKREAKMMHKFWPIYWTFGLQRMQCMICNVIFQEDSDANHDVAGTWTSIRTTYSVRSWASVCGLDWQVNSNGFCTQFCPAAGWSGTIANDSGARATPWDAMRGEDWTHPKSNLNQIIKPWIDEAICNWEAMAKPTPSLLANSSGPWRNDAFRKMQGNCGVCRFKCHLITRCCSLIGKSMSLWLLSSYSISIRGYNVWDLAEYSSI